MEPEDWKLGQRDIKVWKMVGSMEIKKVALDLGMTEGAVRSLLYRMRKGLNCFSGT